nr:glycosyltransferase [Limosilactobacillus gastricus]
MDYLNAMDIFALPSFYEGQPFSLIEAQAAGLPCFVSDKVSQETNVTKNVTYLPIDDVTAWKNEIEFFSFSDNRIDRRDQNVKYLLRNGFSSEDNANKLIKSYDDFKVNRR